MHVDRDATHDFFHCKFILFEKWWKMLHIMSQNQEEQAKIQIYSVKCHLRLRKA